MNYVKPTVEMIDLRPEEMMAKCKGRYRTFQKARNKRASVCQKDWIPGCGFVVIDNSLSS